MGPSRWNPPPNPLQSAHVGSTAKPLTAYEDDFYEWSQEQASLLRRLATRRINLPLDLENLAEEIEDLGREQLRALYREHAEGNARIREIVERLSDMGQRESGRELFEETEGGWRAKAA